MFDENTVKLVKERIEFERHRMDNTLGKYFKDKNEMLGVLYEEFSEVEAEFEDLNAKYCLSKTTGQAVKYLTIAKHIAENLANESIQFAAMCQKAIESEKHYDR